MSAAIRLGSVLAVACCSLGQSPLVQAGPRQGGDPSPLLASHDTAPSPSPSSLDGEQPEHEADSPHPSGWPVTGPDRLDPNQWPKHASGVVPLVPPPAAAPAIPVRLPAEFERQEALVLPAGLLVERSPDTLLRIIEALRYRIALVGVVADAQQRAKVEQALAARGLPASSLRLVELPHNTMWIRDYGPIFVKFPDDHRAAVDAEYPEPGRSEDDIMPGRLANLFHASLLPAAMVFEGGNLLSNGRGLCLTTTATVVRNGGQAYPEAVVRQSFREAFGSTQTILLEPLAGEPTGHVDMFACFTAPDTVVVGSYDRAVDPVNAAILDRNAAALAGLTTTAGPLRVVRVSMPPHPDGIWRTYTNVVFANRVLLVPTYPGADKEGAAKAIEAFAGLLPGWRIVGIDATALIQSGGALRCVSACVPAPESIWGRAGRLGKHLGQGER